MKIIIEAEGDEALGVMRKLRVNEGVTVFAEDVVLPPAAGTSAKPKAARGPKKAKTPKTKEVVREDVDDSKKELPTVVKDVKVAVVAAIKRLENGGDSSATNTVVKVVEDLTGKRKIAEIDEEDYDKVIIAVSELGGEF